MYAIYHLARPSKGRTPASTASYMLFAAVIDASLIPFLVFTALMSRSEYTEPRDTPGAWQTLFGDDNSTYKIIYSTFLFSVVNGGFHLISLLLSLYLAVIFRKIAKLPPDMNPLEDNLTSRHKRNKSSISEKRFSQATTASTSPNSKRSSAVHDPLIAPPRRVPFVHTRTDSGDNPTSQAFQNSRSRLDLPSHLYHQTPSAQVSQIDVQQSPAQYTRSKHGSIYSHASRLPPSTTSPSRPSSVVQPSGKNSLLNDNWFTYAGSTENTPPDHDESVLSSTDTSTSLGRSPSAVSSLKDWELQRANNNSNNDNEEDYRLFPEPKPKTKTFANESLLLNPLELNPPTPPPRPPPQSQGQHSQSQSQPQHQYQYLNERPALASGSGNRRPSMGRRPSSFLGAGKGRYYGDLNAATRAKESATGTGTGTGTYVDGPTMQRGGGSEGRVVSNSGADYGNGSAGGVGRRDVSGKVVEEGRGGVSVGAGAGAGRGWARWRKGSGV